MAGPALPPGAPGPARVGRGARTRRRRRPGGLPPSPRGTHPARPRGPARRRAHRVRRRLVPVVWARALPVGPHVRDHGPAACAAARGGRRPSAPRRGRSASRRSLRHGRRVHGARRDLGRGPQLPRGGLGESAPSAGRARPRTARRPAAPRHALAFRAPRPPTLRHGRVRHDDPTGAVRAGTRGTRSRTPGVGARVSRTGRPAAAARTRRGGGHGTLRPGGDPADAGDRASGRGAPDGRRLPALRHALCPAWPRAGIPPGHRGRRRRHPPDARGAGTRD